MNPVSKVLGPFTISLVDQGNGVFQASVALNAQVGGGQAAGVAQFGGSLFANLNAAQVEQLGFDEFNKILPPIAQPIAAAVEADIESATKSL